MSRLTAAFPAPVRDGARRRSVRERLLGCALAAALLGAVGAGCTGDAPGPLGSSLPAEPGFDTLLVPLPLENFDTFRRIAIYDTAVPFHESQVLYVGRQGNERSSILVRYDFSSFRDDFWREVAITPANITFVRLRLLGLKYYTELVLPSGDIGALVKRLVVSTLADTLVPSRYPASEPAVGNRLASVEEGSGQEISIPLPKAHFLAWVAAGTHTGLVIAEGDSVGSQEGIVGYASKELTLAATLLAPLLEGTTVGPVLEVGFADPDTIVHLLPRDDVSTFSAVDRLPDTPADGLVVRCHVRNSPLIGFSLAGLPPDVIVNRAVLALSLDPTRSYGPEEALVVCETHPASFPAADTLFTLDEMSARVTAAAGAHGTQAVNPLDARRVEFDLTSTVQRWVNGVYTEPLLFALLPAEKFLTAYHYHSWTPGLFWQRFWFHGTTAADSLRPRLLIHYTPRPGTAGRRP